MSTAFLLHLDRELDALRRQWFDVTIEFDAGEWEVAGRADVRPTHVVARVLP